MTPLWIGENLLLARRVVIAGREYVQGCLLDWPAIRVWLRESVEDVLPEVDLEPLREPAAEAESRRLFHPFSKSAHEAANSAPGIGLGLALSHRLARDMGCRLRLDRSIADGAAFVLTLPGER